MTSRKIIALFIGLEVLIIVIALLFDGYSLNALQTITRFSGRLSLLLFSAIFLFYNRPLITEWLSDKFYLLFAVVHGIHLVELLLFVRYQHQVDSHSDCRWIPRLRIHLFDASSAVPQRKRQA